LRRVLAGGARPIGADAVSRLRTWAIRDQGWLWLTPFAVGAVLYRQTVSIEFLLVAVLGIIAAIWVRRHPTVALGTLLVVVPFHQLLFAFLLRMGVPAGLLGEATIWKEALAILLIVTAVSRIARHPRRLDLLDGLAIGFVVLGTAYLLFPGIFVGQAIGRFVTWENRLRSWRFDVLFVGLFFAARHLRFTVDELRRIRRAAIWAAVAVCGIAVFEFFASDAWNDFVIDSLDFPRYRALVLGIPLSTFENPYDIRTYGEIAGRQIVRVGGPQIQYFSLAFYLVTVVALAAAAATKARSQISPYFLLPLAGFALLVTQTRSAVAAGAFAATLAVAPFARRATGAVAARARYGVALAAVLLAALPIVFAIGLGDRFRGDDSSDPGHTERTSEGWDTLAEQPLGRGLGTGAGSNQIRAPGTALVTESQYLQIGTQLGVVGMTLYVGTMVVLSVRLRRLARRVDDDDVATTLIGLHNALIGLAFGSLYLQVFIELSAAWIFWGLAGAAVGCADALVGDREVGTTEPARSPAVA
jgi:hypothetical protein